MSKGGSETSTATSDAPKWLKPYLVGDPKKGISGILPEGEAIYEAGPGSYFPGSTVAPMAPETELALQGTANRALSGNPLTSMAGGYVGDVLSGKYLNVGNPHMDALSNSILSKVGRNVETQFAKAGRTGGGLEGVNLMERGTEALAPYYFQDYENQMGRMDDAARFSPTLAGLDYLDLGALQSVGDRRQQQGQAELSDEVARHNYGQESDQRLLDWYANLIRGAGGGYGTQTQTQPGQSGVQQGLGTALSLAGMAAMFMSDEKKKEDTTDVDTASVADQLADLEIKGWRYKHDPSKKHVGPMAQEFQKRFGVGDGKTIDPVDVYGVLLSAGKEMAKRHGYGLLAQDAA